MPLTAIQTVRLYTSDRPALQKEEWTTTDGVVAQVALEHLPVLASPVPRVWKNNVLQTETTNYTIDYTNGIVTFLVAPSVNDIVVIEYSSVVFSDDEVQHFIDAAGGNATLAASNMLFAWAADAARVSRKEALSGGGGIGSMSISTDMRARELRASAQAYRDQYDKYEGTGVPAEGITEIPWTTEMEARIYVNHYLDDLP